METTWVGLAPTPTETRVVALRGMQETFLKARLASDPSSPRALATLLEALALWEGRRVRAALVVDDRSPCAEGLLREAFPMVGDAGSLVELTWVEPRAPRRRNALRGLGGFADLERRVRETLAR